MKVEEICWGLFKAWDYTILLTESDRTYTFLLLMEDHDLYVKEAELRWFSLKFKSQ